MYLSAWSTFWFIIFSFHIIVANNIISRNIRKYTSVFVFFTTRLFTKIQLKEIHKNHFSSVLKSNFSKNCYISELIHHETSTFFLKSVLKRTFSFFAASKILWTILLSLAPGLNCGHENSLLPKYEISGPDVHARHSLLFSENLSLILH